MIDFPASPTPGQIYNSGTGPLYIWDGVAWSLAATQTRTARQNNLIVNPAMHVTQENGQTVGSTSGYFAVDQWQTTFTGMVNSFAQVVSLTPENSVARIRKTVTTLKASLAAGDWSGILQTIEGTRIASLGWGTANAVQAVLRIGFRGAAGTYSIAVRNAAADRSYIKNFVIAAGQANTDTVQTFVIPPDTTGTWVTSTNAGMTVGVFDAVGSSLQGVEGWQAGGLLGTAANSNMVATNGNVVELFDVGLYPDPDKTGLAPLFIAPLYSDSLIDCKRYWQRYADITTITYVSLSGQNSHYTMLLPVALRTSPTIAFSAVTNYFSTGPTQYLSNAQNLGLYYTASGPGLAGGSVTASLSSRM